MKKELQDDISALYSLVSLDRDGYREFRNAKANRRSNGSEDVIEPESSSDRASDLPLSSQLNESTEPLSADENTSGQERKASKRSISRIAPGRRALKNIRRPKHGAISSRPSDEAAQFTTIFAVSGGAGATTAAALLALIGCRHNENVLLLDGRAADSMLPLYFGGRLGSSGTRSFSPAQSSPDLYIHVGGGDSVLLQQKEGSDREWLEEQVAECDRGVNRIIVDAWPYMSDGAFEYFAANGQCVVLATPDLQSIVGVQRLANRLCKTAGDIRPLLVLNKYDANVPFHKEIATWLQDEFADQFKYFAVTRGDEPAEALAEGMTVLDFSPECPISHDWNSIGTYICNHPMPVRDSKHRPALRAIRA